MDLMTILYGGSKIMLLMVMLFGAYLVSNQMKKGKIRTLLVAYLLIWGALVALDLYSIITAPEVEGVSLSAPPLVMLFSVLSSHLVMLGFFYNLLFTFKKSLRIMAIYVAVVAVVLGIIKCIDGAQVAHFFTISDTLAHAYAGITTPSIISKALLVVMQFSFTLSALYVSNKIVPIYQRYIEQNESNAAYNLLWIKEVSRIVFVATSAYIILVIFITYKCAIVYYCILIASYMRMISILIQNITLESFDELYDKLGIKWSWGKMWHAEEVAPKPICRIRGQFNAIVEWIEGDRPYVDPQFSFKDVTAQFAGVTFTDFDTIVRSDKGHNFQSYIRECRIDYAIELMNDRANNLLLKEIAYKVGFDSSTAFSRAFKATKGVAASEWRASLSSK